MPGVPHSGSAVNETDEERAVAGSIPGLSGFNSRPQWDPALP